MKPKSPPPTLAELTAMRIAHAGTLEVQRKPKLRMRTPAKRSFTLRIFKPEEQE